MGLERFRTSNTDSSNGSNDKIDERSIQIKIDILKAALKYGKDFTQKELNDDSELINVKTIKNNTGLTFNEMKNALDLEANSNKSLTKSDIKSELNELSHPITQRKVIEKCSFSEGLVAKRFGQGSFTLGLKNLGFKVTQEQMNRTRSNTESFENQASEILNEEEWNLDADGYIYTLHCKSENTECYYVGSVGLSKSLHSRISKHIQFSGDFKTPTTKDGDIIQRDKSEEFTIDVKHIINLYKKNNENEEQFKERRIVKEHNRMIEVARSYPNSKVYGGR